MQYITELYKFSGDVTAWTSQFRRLSQFNCSYLPPPRSAQYQSLAMPTKLAIKRAKYVEKYLETNDEEQARAYAGLTSKKTHRNIMNHLHEYQTLDDAPRSGRPPKFDSEVCDLALRVLMGNMTEVLNVKQVVQKLQEMEIVDSNIDIYHFMEVLKKYAEEHEVKLVVGRQKIAFCINHNQQRCRLVWCKKNKQLMNDEWVKSFWWEDEIMIEEASHPQGTWLK